MLSMAAGGGRHTNTKGFRTCMKSTMLCLVVGVMVSRRGSCTAVCLYAFSGALRITVLQGGYCC